LKGKGPKLLEKGIAGTWEKEPGRRTDLWGGELFATYKN